MSETMEKIRERANPRLIRRDPQLLRVRRRVAEGQELTGTDWAAVGRDYLLFSERFPHILSRLIDRDEVRARPDTEVWLSRIVAEERGDDGAGTPHVELFRRFLSSVGVDPDEDSHSAAGPAARELVAALEQLYAEEALKRAIGGQAAFEILSEEIIRNFNWIAANGVDFGRADLTYFEQHLIAEADHVRTMEHVVDLLVAEGPDEEARADAESSLILGAASVSEWMVKFWNELWRHVFDPERSGASVFLSWSGNAAEQTAVALRKVFAQHVLVDPGATGGVPYFWLSSSDIASGDSWRDQLETSVQNARAGVIVLTPESANSNWVNYEAGLLTRPQAAHADDAAPAPALALHALVVSADSDPSFLQGHPLGKFQYVTTENPRSLVEQLWTLLADRHADSVREPTQPGIDEVTEALRAAIKPFAVRADREVARRAEARYQWSKYILSLADRSFTGQPDGFAERLPADLTSWGDVFTVLGGMMKFNFGRQVDEGERVYLAVPVATDSPVYVRLNTGGAVYRFRFTGGASLGEFDWHQDLLVGSNSTIHRAAQSTEAVFSDRDDAGNAEVEGEQYVGCISVRFDSELIGVLGVSTADAHPNDQRIVQQLHGFKRDLEFLFAIVSSRLVRDDLEWPAAAGDGSAGAGVARRAGAAIATQLQRFREDDLIVNGVLDEKYKLRSSFPTH
jgi:pyrroloquinoline quinone (PQQ) biosynthesis protein C